MLSNSGGRQAGLEGYLPDWRRLSPAKSSINAQIAAASPLGHARIHPVLHLCLDSKGVDAPLELQRHTGAVLN